MKAFYHIDIFSISFSKQEKKKREKNVETRIVLKI